MLPVRKGAPIGQVSQFLREVGAGSKREKVGSLGMLFQIWPPKRFRPSEADLLEVGEGEKDLES